MVKNMINRDNDQRKQQLTDRVKLLANTVEEIDLRNRDEAIAKVNRMLLIENIEVLKEFLVDNNCEGEKPRLLVESSGINPKTGIPEDRVYLPHNVPEYHQVMLDMLKKQELVPPDATIENYDFLFEFPRMEVMQ